MANAGAGARSAANWNCRCRNSPRRCNCATPPWYVAHNPQAARALAAWLQATPVAGPTHAVFAALGDKDMVGVVAALADRIDRWWLAGLDDAGPRGLSVDALAEKLAGTAAANGIRSTSVAEALAAARRGAQAGTRILVFGSFHTAAAALGALDA